MGRDASISYEDVASVADSILSAGGHPSVKAIREHLGRGSYTTVYKLLGEWEALHRRQPEIPSRIPKFLEKAVFDFLDQEMAAQRSGLETALSDARQAASEISLENEYQQREIEKLIQAVNAERSLSASLQGRLEQMQAELETIRVDTREAVGAARTEATRERQIAEELRVELAKVKLRLDGIPHLESSLERSHKELEGEREARHEAERAAAATQAGLESKRELVVSLELRLKDQKQRSAEVITKLEADKQKLSAELVETRREASVTSTKLARLEGVFEQMRSSRETAEVVQ